MFKSNSQMSLRTNSFRYGSVERKLYSISAFKEISREILNQVMFKDRTSESVVWIDQMYIIEKCSLN